MEIATQWANILSLSVPEGHPLRPVNSIQDEHLPISPKPGPNPIPSPPAHDGNHTLRLPEAFDSSIPSTGHGNCNIFGRKNSVVSHGAIGPDILSLTGKIRKRRPGALNADQTLTSGSETPEESGEGPRIHKKRKKDLDTLGADIHEENIFEVDSLILHRAVPSVGHSRVEYLVRWAGDWPLDQRYTWEPEENILNATLVGDYWRRLFDIDFAEQETA